MRIIPLNLTKSLKLIKMLEIKSIIFQNKMLKSMEKMMGTKHREPNIKTQNTKHKTQDTRHGETLSPRIKRKKYESKCLRNEK